MIGDDEHGWSDNGVFNFEGGCYAKMIKLSEKAEPEIYQTTKLKGTILENVVIDKNTGEIDLDDDALAENTRGAYPLSFIPNASETGRTGMPKNIILLTCDAFGVLPPIAKLSSSQTMYHFLSGYTAKVAGTEKGVTEPEATFSACFGAPFMAHRPSVYAKLLREKMESNKTRCILLNTGWSGGPAGDAPRISISNTRALLNAALSGDLDNVSGCTLDWHIYSHSLRRRSCHMVARLDIWQPPSSPRDCFYVTLFTSALFNTLNVVL